MTEISDDLKQPVCVNEGTRLILVGKTGSGKSSLGNILLQKKDAKIKKKKTASAAKGEKTGAQERETETATSSSTNIEGQGTPAAGDAQGQEPVSTSDDDMGFVVYKATSSGTKTCCYKETAQAWGRNLKVVDTPGLYDTAVDIRMTLLELTNVMSLSVPGPHAILFVTRLDNRFTQEEDAAFQKILQMFEQKEKSTNPEIANLQDFFFLVFTHGESLDDDETIEEHLEDAPQSLKDILTFVGEKCVVISKTDNREKRRGEVEGLLAKIDRASHGGKVFYTNELLQKMTTLLNEEIESVMKKKKVTWQEADSVVKNALLRENKLSLALQMLTLSSQIFIHLVSVPACFIGVCAAGFFRDTFASAALKHAETSVEQESFIHSTLAKLEAMSRERNRSCVIL